MPIAEMLTEYSVSLVFQVHNCDPYTETGAQAHSHLCLMTLNTL